MNPKRGRKPKSAPTHGKRQAKTEYPSDQPARRDQPGTGQPGDELIPPAEMRRAEGQTESAVEAGFARAPRPAKLPQEQEPKAESAERAARHAEEQLDQAGLEP